MREQQNEEITVTLTLDNDEVLECAVLTIYEAGGRQYIALLPLDENGEEIKFRTMVATMNFMSKLGWNLEQVYNRYDQIDGSPIIIWVLSKEVSSDEEITEGFQTKKMFKEKEGK